MEKYLTVGLSLQASFSRTTPQKFNSEFSPEKWMVGRQSFPIGVVTFQGRTVKLREGIGNTQLAHEISRTSGMLLI